MLIANVCSIQSWRGNWRDWRDNSENRLLIPLHLITFSSSFSLTPPPYIHNMNVHPKSRLYGFNVGPDERGQSRAYKLCRPAEHMECCSVIPYGFVCVYIPQSNSAAQHHQQPHRVTSIINCSDFGKVASAHKMRMRSRADRKEEIQAYAPNPSSSATPPPGFCVSAWAASNGSLKRIQSYV